jgi:hypothetical protein
MILYVNGDSHSAGAELVENYAFADDDPVYKHLGRRPHPDCIPHTFGYKLAQSLNAGFYLDAESGSSNARILRTTQQFLQDNRKQDVFVLIGWSSWDREEWEHNKDYLQVTAGGTDSVPESMEEEYKEWVLKQTMQELDRKQLEWHTKIYELHTTLQDAGIAHLFFNTYSWFRSHVQDPLDWHNCYLDPYNEEGTYNSWCLQNKYKPVRYGSYHYGRNAHIGWYKHLLPRLTNTNSDVTIKTVRSVTQPKVIK